MPIGRGNLDGRVHRPDLPRDLPDKLRQAVDGQARTPLGLALGFRRLIPLPAADERLKVIYRPLAVAKVGVIRILSPLSGGCDNVFICHYSIHPPATRGISNRDTSGTRSTMPGNNSVNAHTIASSLSGDPGPSYPCTVICVICVSRSGNAPA